MTLVVLPAPGGEAAADALGAMLAARVAKVETRRFPDSECYVRIHGDLAGADVMMTACLHDPDPQALGLWFLADAARDLGARRVGLVAPYLPYMRQDQRFQPGEAVTAKTFARFLSSAFDWLVTVDPHLHRIASLDRVYSVPSMAVASASAIAAWVEANVGQPVIVGPDSESEQWAADVAGRAGCPFVVLHKVRLGDRRVEVGLPPAGDWRGRTPVLIDDIISSARTMAAAVRQVRAVFGGAPVCVGVHALFSSDALQMLREEGAARIVTCNTIAHETNGIDVMPLVAAAVRTIQGAAR
jgi:ribose-phosphate pyrophosphokinase